MQNIICVRNILRFSLFYIDILESMTVFKTYFVHVSGALLQIYICVVIQMCNIALLMNQQPLNMVKLILALNQLPQNTLILIKLITGIHLLKNVR